MHAYMNTRVINILYNNGCLIYRITLYIVYQYKKRILDIKRISNYTHARIYTHYTCKIFFFQKFDF